MLKEFVNIIKLRNEVYTNSTSIIQDALVRGVILITSFTKNNNLILIGSELIVSGSNYLGLKFFTIKLFI